MANQPTLEIILELIIKKQDDFSLNVTLKSSDKSVVIEDTKLAIYDIIVACLKESYYGEDRFRSEYDSKTKTYVLQQQRGIGVMNIGYIENKGDDFSLRFRTVHYTENIESLDTFLSLPEIQSYLSQTISMDRQLNPHVPFERYILNYILQEVIFTDEETEEATPVGDTAVYLSPLQVTDEQRNLSGKEKYHTAISLPEIKSEQDLAANDKKRKDDTSSLMPL